MSATSGTDERDDALNGRVVIVEYDPSWPLRFAAERARLAAALAERALAIEHVGSTAVPGLLSGSAIDIAVGLRDLISAGAAVPRLQALGYERLAAGDAEGSFFLRRQHGPKRAYHLSLCAMDSSFWHQHLFVRNRLRADPILARQYADRKRAAAGRRRDYAAAKAEFIRHVLTDGWP